MYFFSFSSLENEMQISRMPIPTDECASSEMSVDINHSHTKSDSENSVNTNGENHQITNGKSIEKCKEKTNDLSDSTEQTTEEDATITNQDDEKIIIPDKPVSDETLDNECSPEVQTEKNTSETETENNMIVEIKVEECEEVSDKLEVENSKEDDSEKQNLETDNPTVQIDEKVESEESQKVEESTEEKNNVEKQDCDEKKESIIDVDSKVTENCCPIAKDNESNEAMEVDNIEISSKEPVNQEVSATDQDGTKEQNNSDLVKPEILTNGESDSLQDIKPNNAKTSEKNSDALPSEDDKDVKSEIKIVEEEEFEKKSNVEEDISSEVSVETPSPKQVCI